jgi:TfoX/Sxy family transcriptional regulator of competence genes
MAKLDYDQKRALYDALIATNPEIERKGKSSPYTSVNGHMFSYLSKEGELGLRLSKEDQAAFVAKYNSEPFIQYGAVMRDYVSVPQDLLADTQELKGYLTQSYNYVSGLKPKPTKRKKK